MTLVVARIIGDEVVILADAKITDPSTLKKSPLTGALKLITTNDLCIGYAGAYTVAIDAIRTIRSRSTNNIKEIIDTLYNVHIASDKKADFIVAAYPNSPQLSVISNGSVIAGDDAGWIGDVDAFSAYQNIYHNTSITDADYRMSVSLNQIVREGLFSSVGNFVVTVRGTDSGFRYYPSTMIFPIRQAIPSSEWTAIPFGSAQQGGYAYSVMTSRDPNVGAIGVYFFQGSVGALYHPIEQDNAIIYSDVGFDDFKEAVCGEYGFLIDGAKLS